MRHHQTTRNQLLLALAGLCLVLLHEGTYIPRLGLFPPGSTFDAALVELTLPKCPTWDGHDYFWVREKYSGAWVPACKGHGRVIVADIPPQFQRPPLFDGLSSGCER